MDVKFSLNDIYDKNINFLIGAGASHGLFPTLALNIKNETGKKQTIETLATYFSKTPQNPLYTLLFMYYYKKCIEPALSFDLERAKSNTSNKKVIDNYKKFLDTILTVLQHRKNFEKNCNIFTTNYDGCFTHVADDLLQKGNTDFVVNDGARGFNRRYLQARNFNSFVFQTGVFERHRTDIPQINLIHLHGSVYWYKDGENILVDYSTENNERLIDNHLSEKLDGFSDLLLDESKKVIDLPKNKLKDEEVDQFWESYKKLPIVNPTKWKFHETVFEEHYYQMLRLLSYELEKPNSVFITFGFSFADEHILNLLKRSLSNPKLQVFICCFDKAELATMEGYFERYKNVQYITVEGFLDFDAFNNEIFTMSSTKVEVPPVPE